MIRKIKGQSTMEYALIIVVVAGALLAMQIFMKRGMENRLRNAADDIGKQFSVNNTGYTRTTNRNYATVEETFDTGETKVSTGQNAVGREEVSTIKRTENVGAWE